MRINSIERLIPFENVEKLYEENTFRYEDSDHAALIWHSNLPQRDKEKELGKIARKTDDKILKQQIDERIEYDRQCLEKFITESSNRYVYVVIDYQFDDDESTCLGFFGTYETARKVGIKAGFDFSIRKHQIIFDDAVKIKHRSITADFISKDGGDGIHEYYDGSSAPVAEFDYRADGENMSFWSDELPLDDLVRSVERLNNKRFENKYVELPNLFEAGDIVRDILTGEKVVVETSQEEWQRNVAKAKQTDAIQDWSDASIITKPIFGDGDYHFHMSPIWLEKIDPLEASIQQKAEMREKLVKVSDSYEGFVNAVLTYTNKSVKRYETVKAFIALNPEAMSSDILEFISKQDDFYEDAAYERLSGLIAKSEETVGEQELTDKQLQGFLRLILSAVNRALEESPDNKVLIKLKNDLQSLRENT